jgi:protein tyrosine/serine phosphatase
MHFNSSRARIWFAAALVSVSFAFPAGAQTPDSRTATAVADIGKIRIDNFGRVNPNYYRGAQPKGQDYADLAALGVKTLIDLTSDDATADEKTMVERAGMTHVRIPMTTHAVPSPAIIAKFLELATDRANQPVYVHCVGGRHRTGVMTAIYRMTQDHWKPDRAFKEMKQYKFGADFLHSEFKTFVLGFRAGLLGAAEAGG